MVLPNDNVTEEEHGHRGENEHRRTVSVFTTDAETLSASRSANEEILRQLEVYAHLVEERLGLEIRNTRLYYTAEGDGNPYITWDKDPQAIEKTIAAFDAIVARIEAKDFAIPARPAKLCENCDMRYYCDAKNWR